MIYEIKNDDLTVKISDLGAEVVSVIYKGKERVWQNDNGSWSGHSPILFPVCGNSAVRIDGRVSDMPFHGFARRSVFFVGKADRKSVTFVLEYNEETLKVYPFAFRLSVNYSVKGNSLIIKNKVDNLGGSAMPFALGRHDSFLLDGPIDNYKICFENNEELLSQKTDETGRLINLYADLGTGKEFVLPNDYLSNGQTIIFGNIKSRCVSLKTLDDRLIAEVFFPQTSNLLLWRPDGAQMICIEPWSALPDESCSPVDFFKNEKYYSLGQGNSKTIDFQIDYKTL